MRKISFFIICLLLLSGCSAVSNNEVLNDGKVVEKVIFSENVKDIYLFEGESLSSHVQSTINDYFGLNRSNDYIYNKEINDDFVSVEFSKTHDDICNYFNNSPFITTFMNEKDCNETDEFYEINAKSSYFVCDEDCFENPELDSVSLSFTFNQEVIYSNADLIDNNTYTWNFNGTKDNTFSLRISKPKRTIIEKLEIPKSSKLGLILIIGAIMVVFLIIVALINKNRKNRIDYK